MHALKKYVYNITEDLKRFKWFYGYMKFLFSEHSAFHIDFISANMEPLEKHVIHDPVME